MVAAVGYETTRPKRLVAKTRLFLADNLSRAFLPAGKQDESEFETINMMKYLPVSEESSPHHSQGNGKAESAVKEAKKILRKCRASGSDAFLALLDHRNTPPASV